MEWRAVAEQHWSILVKGSTAHDDLLDRIGAGEAIEHAIFYCRLSDRTLLDTIEFYAEDLRLLRTFAKRVTVCTSLAELRRAEPGLLWAWWHASAFPAVVVWRSRNMPMIVTGAVDLSNPLEPRLRHSVKRRITAFTGNRASLNVAISDYEAADLRSLVPEAKVVTLHPGVDCDYYNLGVVADTPLLVTVGQVNPKSIYRKGIDRCAAVLVAIQRTFPDASLKVIGPVTAEGDALLRERGLYEIDGLEFCGKLTRDDKRRLLQHAWVYLQLSRYEGFGLAVGEAMACGAVPLVTDVGSLPEVVGRSGSAMKYDLVPVVDRLGSLLRERGSTPQRIAARSRAEAFATSTRYSRFVAALAATPHEEPTDRSRR